MKPLKHLAQIFSVLLLILLVSFSIEATTFTVTKITDTNDGICDIDCSLREAIETANSNKDDDSIVFDQNVFNTPQIIVLSGTELSTRSLSGALKIIGLGTDLLSISGNNSSRVFLVEASSSLQLENLTITDGNSTVGGGIKADGGLLIDNVVVKNNFVISNGGGIFSSEINTLNIYNSVIKDNTAGSRGGGLFNRQGNINVYDSKFISNFSEIEGGGIWLDLSSVIISRSILDNNQAQVGGGMYSTATPSFAKSTVSNNTATINGGGIYIRVDC